MAPTAHSVPGTTPDRPADAAVAGTAAEIAAAVCDPELPMLTLGDLGILREVRESAEGVRVSITPTYSGCPAMEAIRDDVRSALRAAGYQRVEVRTVLDPPWTTDWITEAGRGKLAAAGIAPPGAAPRRGSGPVPLVLEPVRRPVRCPRCARPDTELIATFSATACRELRRCPACREPFEHVKEI
jgi:ring-1,2-phenylacetyl-CoA epoxidase subunit PaaD